MNIIPYLRKTHLSPERESPTVWTESRLLPNELFPNCTCLFSAPGKTYWGPVASSLSPSGLNQPELPTEAGAETGLRSEEPLDSRLTNSNFQETFCLMGILKKKTRQLWICITTIIIIIKNVVWFIYWSWGREPLDCFVLFCNKCYWWDAFSNRKNTFAILGFWSQ